MLINNEKTVVLSNIIAQKGVMPLSLQEYRLLSYFISEIQYNDDPTKIYQYSVSDIAKALNIDKGNDLTYMKRAIQALYSRNWFVNDGKRQTIYNWFGYLYIEDGAINIRWHETVSPFLFQLKGFFTEYRLDAILNMNSKYGARLFTLLHGYLMDRDTADISVSVEYLKTVLMADNYTAFRPFEVRCLAPAVEDINRNRYGDIVVEYSKVKKGRNIDKIAFHVDRLQ